MKLPIKKLPAQKLANFGQYRLNWRSSGHGNPVILLHGISSGSASWINQLASSSLTEHYQLHCWDAPGYSGSSELSSQTPTALDYAKVLKAFLDGLKLEQVVLVGHSLGAIIVSAFASQYPQQVKGLFIANPAQGYGTKSPEQRNSVYEQRREIVFHSGFKTYAQNRAAFLLSPSASPEKIDWVKQNIEKLNPQGFLAASWMLANDDINLYLNDYNGPIEILAGTDDTITPPQQVQQLATQKACPFWLVKQAGHASYLDTPTQFNHHLKQFLETVYNSVI